MRNSGRTANALPTQVMSGATVNAAWLGAQFKDVAPGSRDTTCHSLWQHIYDLLSGLARGCCAPLRAVLLLLGNEPRATRELYRLADGLDDFRVERPVTAGIPTAS